MSSLARAVTGKSGLAILAVLVLVAAGGPSSAQPQAQAQAPAGGQAALDKGRDTFTNYGCGNCHTLGDAGATGHVGPAFDGNTNLSEDFIVSRVANGQGMMPSFSGQLSSEEISTLAAYIMKVQTK